VRLTLTRIALGVTVIVISSSVFADSKVLGSNPNGLNSVMLAQAQPQIQAGLPQPFSNSPRPAPNTWDYMKTLLLQSQPFVARADDLPVSTPKGNLVALYPTAIPPAILTVAQTAPIVSPTPGVVPSPDNSSQGGLDADADEENDPIESFNRAIFGFNEVFYEYILGPTSSVYKNYTPDFFQDMVGNLFGNLREPLVMVNDLLQLEGERAAVSAGRLMMNTVVGVGGLFEVAAKFDLERHKEDLGQTLATWGVGDGFYIVLPILGPSNPRDIIGQSVEGYFNPLNRWISNTGRTYITYARSVVSGIHVYSQVSEPLGELRETSVDYYATIRSLSRQRRKAEILNGQIDELPAIPDMDVGFGVEGEPVPGGGGNF
jgi:phospholipid-binding lipoprotein MlaA